MASCLAPGVWEQVEAAVDRALAAMAASQKAGGDLGEAHPASTAMAVMAFLSRGHVPGRGRYGDVLDKAVDSVLLAQDAEGVIGVRISNYIAYMHGMAGLMLGEVYGLTRGARSAIIRDAIVKALAITRRAQSTPKPNPSHKGGVRYFENLADADLSVTGWHFMFYRSAKNAEFDVPESWVAEMLQFVSACKAQGVVQRQGPAPAQPGIGFAYQPGQSATFAMSAVGLLCMTMAGKNDHPLALSTADMLLRYDPHGPERYRVYGLYYASLAMAQLGGEYWRKFYPRLVDAYLKDPLMPDGLWTNSDILGPVIGTAFRVLSLTPPCQLLPIFQR
ncbi:MAG TPA: hypothetical protein VG796_06820 [Verrucomicrobiales bacterium]|nr:hypothetical protein [Verrucomicrobiales bacterium]